MNGDNAGQPIRDTRTSSLGVVRPLKASIRTKLIVLSTLLILSTFGIYAYVSLQQLRSTIDGYAARLHQSITLSLQQAGRAQLSLLATAVRIALLQSDYGSLQSMARDIKRDDPRITKVGVYDREGRPLASLGDEISDEALRKRLTRPTQLMTINELTVGKQRSIAFSTPIRYGDRIFGAVLLTYSLKTLEAELAAAEQTKASTVAVTLRNALVIGLFAALLATFLTVLQGLRISRPIRSLALQANRVAQGDFEARVEIGSSDELGQLGDVFNHMSRQMVLLMHAAGEKAALEREFELANTIQRALLPDDATAMVGGLELASFFQPASECGGDWWHYFELPEEKALVVLGDVTGHGVPAAMISAVVKGAVSTLFTHVGSGEDLQPFLSRLSQIVHEVGRERFYMSCFALLYCRRTNQVSYANAGHTFPYVCPSDQGDISSLVARGSWLGQAGDATFQIGEATLQRGDAIVLYTDGAVEIEDPAKQAYGDGRLRRLLARNRTLSPAELRDRIVESVYDFAGGEPAKDDITVVVARVS